MGKDVDVHVKEVPHMSVTTDGDMGVHMEGLNNMRLSLGNFEGQQFRTKSEMTVETTSHIGGVPQQPVVMENNISVRSLPVIRFAMEPTRIHFPIHMRFCLSALGMELMAFSVCGESMVVVEPYEPHETERCF